MSLPSSTFSHHICSGTLAIIGEITLRTLVLIFTLLVLAQSTIAQEPSFQIGHTHDILTVKFSPDDSQLVSFSGGDGRFCLWDVTSGRLIWMSRTSFIRKANENINLQEFYWSADEEFVVTKSANGTYQVWDAKKGRILSISDSLPNIPVKAEQVKKILVTKDYENFYLTASDSKEIRTIKPQSRTGNTYDVSHDGTLFAEGGSWGDASIKITNTKTGQSRYLDGHPSVVITIAYSPDGNVLAVGGSDKSIYLFDVATQALIKTLVGHTTPITSVAFSPDGRTLLSSSEDPVMKVWNWNTGAFLRDVKSEEDNFGVLKVLFSGDGKHLLTRSSRVEFRLWDAVTWKLVRNFKTKEGYESGGGGMTLGYEGVPVTSAMFSRDGKKIFTSHVDGTLRTWNVNQGNQIDKIRIGEALPFFQISSDEKTILAATEKNDEIQIKLVDAKNGKIITNFDDEETSYVEDLSISPDGKHFATTDVSGDVMLWDIKQLKPIRELDIGFSGDDAVAFSPDGKTLAVGGRNQNLFMFDIESGNKLWQLIPSYQPTELETRLTEATRLRQAALSSKAAQRDKQAAIDTEVFKSKVHITFEHYGDMTDPGQLRMLESSEPNKSKVKKSAEDGNAVWLRLHNDSPLPISIPTQSMYMPDRKCFFEFSSGKKLFGLCADREISIWFGLEDKNGKALHYGYDFGSSAILLPNSSAIFAVPRAILQNRNAISFSYSFQSEAAEDKIDKYGEERTLKFRESDIADKSR